MASPRYNQKKGSAFETGLVKGLREMGYDAERLHLAGAEDEGDLVVRWPDGKRLVVEAKSGALHPTQFLKELSVEVEHYKAHRSLTSGVIGTVVCKQVGKADPLGGYCLLPTRDLLALLDGLDPLDL